MRFAIQHITEYRYGSPSSEAYIEARVTPPELPTQKIIDHRVEFIPASPTSSYRDHFGNTVQFYTMVSRHERIAILSRLTVETRPPAWPEEALAMPVADARQIVCSNLTEVFEYLQPTPAVPTGGPATDWAKKVRGGRMLREVLDELNTGIHSKFAYVPGSTDNSTPLAKVWKQRKGVCQDFAHILLSILRTAGLPCRYVCGYIESAIPGSTGGLLGSLATHAWVEVLVPGMVWIPLDPTNNQWCGERHIATSFGRDFRDAAPVRGTFKGSGSQRMRVRVTMRRIQGKS